MKKIMLFVPIAVVIVTTMFLFPSEAKALGRCVEVELIPREAYDAWSKFNCIDVRTVTTGFWPWEIETKTYRTAQIKWHRVTNIVSTTTSREQADSDGCSRRDLYDHMYIEELSAKPSDVFRAACVEHDYCYVTLDPVYWVRDELFGNWVKYEGQVACDLAFYYNMLQICHAMPIAPIECEMVAQVMFRGVQVGGKDSYDWGQKVAKERQGN